MTPPPDPVLLELLRHHVRELATILAHVEAFPSELIPPPESQWRGVARRAYADAMQNLASAVHRAEASVRVAHELAVLAERAVEQ